MTLPDPHRGFLLPGEIERCKLSCPIPDGYMPIILHPFRLTSLTMTPEEGSLVVRNVGNRPAPFAIGFVPMKIMKGVAGASMVAQELWRKYKGRAR